MSIAEFIRESVLCPRLKQAGALVVYDADKRYRELCCHLAADKVRVVDASESSIESREAALLALREVGHPRTPLEGVLIYVPRKRPENDEDKQADPFALYAECGAVFPQDDGDDYLSLCLRAKPDHATQIRKVFSGCPEGPSFAVIDAIGSGSNWPQLRAALRVESAREILRSLLAPTKDQGVSLKEHEGWAQEAKDFLHATLGMNLKTRGKTWNSLADELWRFILFSEFVFDLPCALPTSLEMVPKALPEARAVVEDVCEQLRNTPQTRSIYIDRAEKIEAELQLPEACAGIDDLGELDTFSFEERTFLLLAIKDVLSNDLDRARRILARRKNSVWMSKGESRDKWELVRAAVNLIEACEDFERQLPDHARTQEALISFYLSSMREADRMHREFEQAVSEFIDQQDLMKEIILSARSKYCRLSARVQALFMKHVESSGWPPTGRLMNDGVFNHFFADKLKVAGAKMAYFMIDSLRYELGVALEKHLSEDGLVEIHAACAQIPTITPVGMASLLPGAHQDLEIFLDNDIIVPKMADSPVCNVNQRMDYFKKRFGDRFAEMALSDFVRTSPGLGPTVDLLVLRSTEIDSHLESNPETTLSLIPKTLKLIRMAMHKLRQMGFCEAVIATDHGFFLNAEPQAGDVCRKPQGTWPANAHNRVMLGDGVGDEHNLVLGAAKVGIKGNIAQVAMPRSMATYRAGQVYFHGGLSLQEAIVPVLIARLEPTSAQSDDLTRIKVSYKNGAKKITTRIPVIDMEMEKNMLLVGKTFEILLEAQDTKGNVVGEPRPGGEVDPATQLISIASGQRKQIALRMDPEFEGKFSVKALNPVTLSTYGSLILETDYTV